MNAVHSLAGARIESAILFAAMVVFAVVSLELLRDYATHATSAARVRTIAALLAFAFLSMTIGGVWSFAITNALGLANLGAFLTGVASLGILLDVVFRGRRDHELRRISAHDL